MPTHRQKGGKPKAFLAPAHVRKKRVAPVSFMYLAYAPPLPNAHLAPRSGVPAAPSALALP